MMQSPQDLKTFSGKIHEYLSSNPLLLPTGLEKEEHKPTEWLDAETAQDVKKMSEDGYVIIKNLLTPEYLQDIKDALKPYLEEGQSGRNRFEGRSTQRVYGMLAKDRRFDYLCMHPRIVKILDYYLLPNPLLTAYQAINIHPGEKRQPFHYDDQFMNVTRPHRPFSISTIWAIDDFTAMNGGTVVIPKSHKWEARFPTAEDIEKLGVSVEMPAGSVVVFLSTLWHGGGANVTPNVSRCAVSAQYCEPWIRPQENMQFVVPLEKVADLHPTLQSMIGYSIHPPFIGHINGLHPLKTLQLRLERYNLPNNKGITSML